MTPIDLREEMDETTTGTTTVSSSSIHKEETHIKAKFLIRTLPKECNPTPIVPLRLGLGGNGSTSTGSSDASSTGSSSISPLKRTSLQRPPSRQGHGGNHDMDVACTDGIMEEENPFDDLTEDKLIKHTGQTDLTRVKTLDISVDSGKQSVEVIGELLPSLQQLRLLAPSFLHSFRDLGTSLHNLRILWVSRCGIKDLDGIGALTALQELYLPYNSINDLSPLTMHEELQVIDLEGNEIVDIGQVEQLAFCPLLTSLNLENNPITQVSSYYRQIIGNFVPQLSTLDDQTLTEQEKNKLDDTLIDEAIENGKQQVFLKEKEEKNIKSPTPHRPSAGSNRIIDWMLGSNSNSTSSCSTMSGMNGGGSMGMCGMAGSGGRTGVDDYGSTLTHGTDIVFAGNVTSALRRRRSENETADHLSPVKQRMVPQLVGHAEVPVSSRVQVPEQHQNIVSSLNDLATSIISTSGTVEGGSIAAATRMSITETLDRAKEIEKHSHKHKSRDAIMNELKQWKLENASQLGVTHVAISPRARPSTSAGGSRQQLTIANAEGSPNTRRTQSATSSFTITSTKRSQQLDILTLDTGSTPIINSGLPSSSEWNLDLLSPTIVDAIAKKLPKSTTPSVKVTGTGVASLPCPSQPRRSSFKSKRSSASSSSSSSSEDEEEDDDDDENVTGSGNDTSNSSRRRRRQSSSNSSSSNSTSVTTTSAVTGTGTTGGLASRFDVLESLNAIDKWREQMHEDDDEKVLSLESYQIECLSPRPPTATAATSRRSSTGTGSTFGTTSSGITTTTGMTMKKSMLIKSTRGPANDLTNETIIQLMLDKTSGIASEIKTRDGFRRYFNAISKKRLEQILNKVFKENQDKVQKRIQLMEGFFDQVEEQNMI